MKTSPSLELFQEPTHSAEFLRGYNSRNAEVAALQKKIEELSKLPANQKRQTTDQTRIRIGKMFGRRDSTKWSAVEIKALKDIGTPDESELALMEEFYRVEEEATEKLYRRTSLERLLKYWSSELDKAREWKRQLRNRR